MLRILGVVALLVLFFGIGGYLYFKGAEKERLARPVLGITSQSEDESLWFPVESSQASSLKDAPEITAKAALFVDGVSGEILYEKDMRDILPIASLTKIMTSIVTLERKNWGDRMRVSDKAASVEPDEMILLPGELMSVEELMDGLLLVSANDSAEVFAGEVTGSRSEFIELMNQKALKLGMKDSEFINPTGLEEGEDWNLRHNMSSAYDVLIMSRYAIHKWPKLLDISSNPHIFIPATPDHQDYDLYSGINLVTTYPGVLGFKTGYTPEAGLTLVTIARKGGFEVLGVLLGAEDRRGDARKLLDYSFNKMGVKVESEL